MWEPPREQRKRTEKEDDATLRSPIPGLAIQLARGSEGPEKNHDKRTGLRIPRCVTLQVEGPTGRRGRALQCTTPLYNLPIDVDTIDTFKQLRKDIRDSSRGNTPSVTKSGDCAQGKKKERRARSNYFCESLLRPWHPSRKTFEKPVRSRRVTGASGWGGGKGGEGVI